MRACKNLWMAKKRKQEDLKDRVIYLQRKIDKLYKTVEEQEHRIVQLEIARKLGN